MGKVNRTKYSQKSDQVGPDDIDDAAIVTVSDFADGERKDGEGMWALLKFEELGDKVMFLSDDGMDAMLAAYGDESDDWIGKPVPLEKYSTKRGDKVRIMAADAWDAAFKEAGVKRPVAGARTAARPATRAATTKPSAGRR
jgi:hypothetical protein